MGGIIIKSIGLKDIVDIDVLQEIQDRFSDVTKLAVIIVDFKGEPITRASNFTRFCNKFREDDNCKYICYKSDAHGGVEAASGGKPFIYTCHTGLVDLAIPIVFEGQFLGSILAGQVKVEGNCFAPAMRVVPGFVKEMKEESELKAYFDEISVVKPEEVIGAADLLHIMANYIVEKGFTQLIQEELNEKNAKLIEEMKTRMELEKHLRDSELQLLKSQVNPHFLFNVLNTINSLAMIEKAPKTSEMIYSLSEMLRYSLKNEMNHLVSIEQEIDYTLKYLNIQKTRIGEKLKYNINVPEKYLNIKIPFMIIQPIIANAITHGLFGKDDGLVSLFCYDDKENVYVVVADNGVGMEKEKIDKIFKGEFKGESSTGIGLINADKRLIHQFGEKYHLKIESFLGKGTKVTIKLPK